MKKVFAEMKEYTPIIIFTIIGIGLSTLADLILPRMFATIVDYIGEGSNVTDAVLQVIKSTSTQMLLVVVVTAIAATIGNYTATRISTGLGSKLRSKLFAKVQTFTDAEMSQFGTSTLITRTTNDIEQIQQFISISLRIFVRAPIIMVAGIIMAAGKNIKLAMPILVATPIIAIVITLISRKIIPLFQKLQSRVDDVNRVLREQITGVRVLKAFGTEDYEEERFDGVNTDYKNISLKMAKITSAMGPFLSLVLNLTIVSIMLLAANMVSNGAVMQNSDLMTIMQYVTQILFAFVMLSMVFAIYPRAEASASRVYEVLDTVPMINDLQEPVKPIDELKGQVEFRNVSFGFPSAEKLTLEGINFKVKPGETLGIIGSTGSGKSTLLKMILRFYDAIQGSVLVSGVDVREVSQKNVRETIGYVPQQIQLFSGTIESNLKLGNKDATSEELVQSSQTAQAYEFISEKDGTFLANVSRSGTNFSGGQKQRLSIARALVKKPEIYIFDDSFSALDAKTDVLLRQALAKNEADATQIIVSSKIATILGADQIIVLDSGKIVGKGTHDELMKTCGVYKEIADSQFGEEETA